MESFLALCSRQPGNELIAAECESLTGGRPDAAGIARCHTLDNIPHAAYIRAGIRLIAGGETLDDLIAAISRCSFEADHFRIEFRRYSERNGVRQEDAILAVANAIQAHPNLRAPRHRFLLASCEQGFLFGEIEREPDHSYRRQDTRPYRTTSSLPARLARALVNLVAPPARTIFDPCCGTGSILLEAKALGLAAFGSDRNPRMVGMSRLNLAHFGYQVQVSLAEARETNLAVDAIVTDLPYGLCTTMDKDNILGILTRAVQQAPVAVFVAGSDISVWLQKAGYENIEVFRIKKQHTFIRYVHRARSSLPGSRQP